MIDINKIEMLMRAMNENGFELMQAQSPLEKISLSKRRTAASTFVSDGQASSTGLNASHPATPLLRFSNLNLLPQFLLHHRCLHRIILGKNILLLSIHSTRR